MKRIATVIALLALVVAPAAALAQPTAVSSSAQQVADAAGDAASGADLTAFALSTTASSVDLTWTLAPGADLTSQQLAVCAAGHGRVVCIDREHPGRVRIGGASIKAHVTITGQNVRAVVPASALGYSAAAARMVRFRAHTSIMRSTCPERCDDFSPAAIAAIG